MASSSNNTNGKSGQQLASSISIEDLYKYFGILADAKQDAGKHVDVYLNILSGTKSGSKEKQLASQFITRFFSYFPKEMAQSIDAIFDLCEDEDVNIRKAAIKDLSIVCKDCTPELLNRIADILTQLLQTDDQQEFFQVQSSLLTVLKQNPKLCLNEIFNQINTAELEEVRKRAIKFLVSKIPMLIESSNNNNNNQFNKDFEDLVIKNIKQVLVDVDAEEFILFIKLLTALPSMSTLQGRQELVNIIMSQCELEKPYDCKNNDMERLMILMSCLQQALPLFSKNVPSTRYVYLYLNNVIASSFKNLQDQEENIRFELLKAFAELCIHFNPNSPILNNNNGNSNNLLPTNEILDSLFNLLIEYLPLPPPIEAAIENNSELQKEQQQTADEKFNFSYVECLLYAFHMLVKFNQEYLSNNNDQNTKERLRDFRFRLQHFAKGTQNYIKELRHSITTSAKEDEENKIRRVALKVTTNIDSLIKDFFHNPPTYKSQIILSWKSIEGQKHEAVQQQSTKRSLSVDNHNGDNSNRKKPERGIYHPPSGKYSHNNNNNSSSENNHINSNKRRTFSNDPQVLHNNNHNNHRFSRPIRNNNRF